MFIRFTLYLIIGFTFFSGCGISDKEHLRKTEYSKNFFLSVYDADINNPDQDRTCYYMVYIDKMEAGRTNTGLESQEKYFEELLTPNRHLIKIEKWILNESLGRYIKLNNIDQPKPDFIYINIEKDKIVRIKIKSSRTGIASFSTTVD
jgi:hypothetical protein